MGFDNECILNIQSLPGEYFCPVCRTLVYPNEAVQTQCTHLYCKPCLAYIAATTCACPYDGYLVSEADAKPLMESNKPTAEAIEKIQVHCLYHRSGCQWQGTLSECITHCTSCNFGNSPVVCNRCGTQIIHRQVQEHAQICPGVQPQAQQADNTQNLAAAAQNQSVAQPMAPASQEATSQAAAPTPVAVASSAPVAAPASATAATAVVPTSSVQDQGQPSAAVQSQAAMQAPTTEQWYQQQQLQYQQYYQQYPGYDPYQQHYQQHGYYPQQVQPQYPQAYVQPHPVQGQQHSLGYAQQQPQAQPQALAQPPQSQVQTHPYPQPAPVGQLPQFQAPANLQQPVQVHPQQPQMHPSTQSQVPGQPLGQPQTQTLQLQPQPLPHTQPPHLQPQVRPHTQQPVVPQHPPQQLQQQQPHTQYQPQPNLHTHTQQPVQQPPLHMQLQSHPRPHSLPQPQPQPQIQLQPQLQPQPLPQPQLQPHPQGQPQPQRQLHPAPAHAVTGHQSFPQAHLPQTSLPGAATHQRPMHMHPVQQGVTHQQLQHPAQMQNQYQQPPQPQMRPLPSQMPVQGQQQAAITSVQGPHMHLPPAQQQPPHLLHPSTQQTHHPPGMQGPLQHSSIPQQQAQLPPHHSQLHHQGSFPPQQQMHPQQASRPQGPPFMQQTSQLQPVSQMAPRPVASTHTMPQQPFAQSPDGSGLRPQLPSDHRVGSVQLVQMGSQNAALLSSPTNLKPTMDEKLGDSPSDKAGHAPIETSTEKDGEVSADLKKQKLESNLKNEGEEERLPEKVEESSQSIADGEPIAPLVKDEISEAKPISKEEASGIPEHSPNRVLADVHGIATQETKEIERNLDGSVDNSLHGHGQGADTAKQLMHHDATRNVKPLGPGEKAAQNFVPQGPTYGNEGGSVHGPPRQPVHLNAPPAYDSSAPTHDRAFQPGFPDRNMHQIPPQGPVPGDPRGFPPTQMQPNVLGPPTHHPSMHDHEYLSQQPPPHAPPYMQDATPQRPPAPDRMLAQHMPPLGTGQERMFQEPPRAIQAPGQPMAPNQMRPSFHNFPENLVHQGQPPVMPDPFQVNIVKHPPGGFPGQGLHAPAGRGPTSFGPPQGPPLPGQGQMLPPSNAGAIGSRISHVEPFAGGPMTGPPGGSFDAAAAMNARGPPIYLEGQLTRSHPHNPLEAEVYANKMPGPYDGRQPDHHRSMPSEHFPCGMQPANQPNMMMMNGFPGKVADSSISHGPVGERFKPLPEERCKSLAEEGLKLPAEDRFRPYGMDPGRRIVDRRDFEEDLKQFPRPSDLDSEVQVGLKFENYLSSSRPPVDRSSHTLGLDATFRSFDRGFGSEGGPKIGGTSPVPSRLMPTGQLGGHVPVGSGGSSLHPMDTMERQRPLGLRDDNMGRTGDPARTDFHRRPSDFGRHRMDSQFFLRSPGRELSGLPSSRFGSFSMGPGLGSQTRLEEFGSREPHAFGDRSKQHNLPPDSIGLHDKVPILPPSHFRRSDADALRAGEQLGSGNLPGHTRSGILDGHDMLPNHMRGDDPLAPGSGSFRSHLHLGELSGMENVPSHLRSGEFSRFGEPGFGSSFLMHGFPNELGGLNSGSFQGGLDPLDQPRKRKLGSISWCRICKIDCETLEGLDLHSQTKEHQKTAMDIVLSIKQDNAKKQKVSSEEHEEVNKSRKAGFEGRPSRH